jgi:hypothetical protein
MILFCEGSSDTGKNGGPVHGKQGAHQAQPQEALPIRWLCCQGAYQGSTRKHKLNPIGSTTVQRVML